MFIIIFVISQPNSELNNKMWLIGNLCYGFSLFLSLSLSL